MKTLRAFVLAVSLGCSAAGVCQAASIGGTVTASGLGAIGIAVDVWLWDPVNSVGELVDTGATGPDGNYVIPNLAAGNYRLGFRDETGTYAPKFYADAAELADGTSVVVTASQAATGINVSLVSAASVSGTVTAPDGTTPLEGISIGVYRLVGGSWILAGENSTLADGTYAVGGLAAGTYRVGFFDPAGAFSAKFYNDAHSLETADDVSVSGSSNVAGINASLAPASAITGTVTGPGGGALLNEITVGAYRWDDGLSAWLLVSSAVTDQIGSYSIGGLSAGSYRVEFVDSFGNYLSEYYDNVPDIALATDIIVASSSTTAGINAALAYSGYDVWAAGYGLDPVANGAPTADPDSDGFANRSEYAFGTDPTSGTAALLAAARAGGDLLVTYLRKNVGINYLPAISSNLSSGNWSAFGGVLVPSRNQEGVPAGYSRVQQTVPASGKAFFRVEAVWN